DAEILARRGLDEAAANRVARSKRHCVHNDVERVPLLAEHREGRCDALVACDVHLEHAVGAELRGHRCAPSLEALLITEGELSAFAMHRLSDAVRDRALGREADDQDAFAGEKSHGLLRKWT